MQSKSNKSQKEENQIGQVLAGYISYWPLFILCSVLAVGISWVYIRYTVPKYEAAAKLIIKDEKKGNQDSKGITEIDQINTKKIIENETEVLKSTILIDSVVNCLRLYAPIVQEGKLRKIPAYTSSPVLVEAQYPDSIRGADKILLKFDSASMTVQLNNNFSGKLDTFYNTPYGKLKFVKNPNYFWQAGLKPFFFSLVPVKNISNSILGPLKVIAPSKTASVLDITITDEVPKRAEDILNKLIYFYDLQAITEKNNLVKNTLLLIDNRLVIIGKKLDSIQQKVKEYKKSSGAVELGIQGSEILQGIGASDKELGNINVQLDGLNRLENFVSSNKEIGILPAGLGISDQTLTQQMVDLNNKQTEYEKLKKTVGENNPALVSLTEEISRIKPLIIANIRTQRTNLEASRNNLFASSSEFGERLSNLPEKERELLEISRDENIQNGIYQFLLQKKEDSYLSYTSVNQDSKVINFAQAGAAPVSPKKMMIYLSALLFGLAVPVVLINGREMLNSKVMYRKEIENLTAIPVIGEIVHNNTKTSLVLEPGKRSFIAEEFRKIRVSLLFLGIDSYHKKILITSSIPGEGKSFIAANLAVSLAMTGKKVVLVDLDLHNPALGKLFNLAPEESGVSDFLLRKKEASEIVRKLPAHENLFFVSSGGLHPTPSELLENGQIQKLISYLEDTFDLVIIDSAPVVLVTDAYHLSSISDATLYVIRHKFTPKMLLRRIDENNKINSLKNPAIIFNAIKKRGYLKNNYGYGYDYVYGNNQKITKRKKFKA